MKPIQILDTLEQLPAYFQRQILEQFAEVFVKKLQ